jgi:predicted CXXCH cytochrome family protein
VLYSCSSSSTNNALTFLFDGVPSKDTLKSVNGQDVKSDSLSNTNQNNNRPIVQIFVLHDPYKEKMCESCHDINVSFKKIIDLPELCYQCHEDFKSTYKNLHYPIEAGECNSCHHPHQAKLTKLLLKTVRELCVECHDLDELIAGGVHSGIGEMECTECHNPHGSNDNSLLR